MVVSPLEHLLCDPALYRLLTWDLSLTRTSCHGDSSKVRKPIVASLVTLERVMDSYLVNRPQNSGKPYAVRYDEGRKQKSFATEIEAKDFQAKIRLGLADSSVDTQTFGVCAERWISRRKAPRTREAYTSVLRNHLTAFVSRPVAEVAQDARSVEDACYDHPRGHHMLVVLRGTCQMAVRDGLADGHRLDGIELTRHESEPEARFFPVTFDQVKIMANSLGREGLTIYVMYLTGVRISECLALRSDDFRQGYVRVARQLDRMGTTVPLKGRSAREFRDVPCPDVLADYLGKHVAEYGDGVLFTVLYRNYWNKFRLAAARAGLPEEFTPHCMRHLFVSMMLDAGLELDKIAKWLGHRNVQVTYNTYGHLMPAGMDRAKQASELAWSKLLGEQ